MRESARGSRFPWSANSSSGGLVHGERQELIELVGAGADALCQGHESEGDRGVAGEALRAEGASRRVNAKQYIEEPLKKTAVDSD